jgi:hypothetical protein
MIQIGQAFHITEYTGGKGAEVKVKDSVDNDDLWELLMEQIMRRTRPRCDDSFAAPPTIVERIPEMVYCKYSPNLHMWLEYFRPVPPWSLRWTCDSPWCEEEVLLINYFDLFSVELCFQYIRPSSWTQIAWLFRRARLWMHETHVVRGEWWLGGGGLQQIVVWTFFCVFSELSQQIAVCRQVAAPACLSVSKEHRNMQEAKYPRCRWVPFIPELFR